MLKLMGRIDDVLILAGFKRGADEYEADACAVPGVQEACALAVADAIGVERLVLCIVKVPGSDHTSLVLAISKKFPPFITEGASVYFVEALPRTDNGKLKRAVMKAGLPQLTGRYALSG
jgi:acyl-coenzyme A synthetase/AMP-(fatty) acid ligase